MKRPNTYQLGFAYPQTLTSQSMQEAAPGCIWSRSAGSMEKKISGKVFWKNFTLFRHKFDIVHEMFCKKGMLGLCLGRVSSFIGAMIPASKTISRRSGPSPAILPKAQTACSTTSGTPQLRRRTKDGTAPCSTTARVWLEWPEAILVKAQAASNCNFRFVSRERKLTKRGRTPA